MSKYQTVDEYILAQDASTRILIFLLRDIILSTSTEITERLSFNCPFYHYKGMLCYISIRKENGLYWLLSWKLSEKQISFFRNQKQKTDCICFL
jgi:hypothetical protein